MAEFRFCPMCASALAWQSRSEDGGEVSRLRCTSCDYTHWNNPTPVLAGIVEVEGKSGLSGLFGQPAFDYEEVVIDGPSDRLVPGAIEFSVLEPIDDVGDVGRMVLPQQ
jgi:ribosomal protein S27AE